MAKTRSNLVIVPIMAPDVAVVVLIIVAQVMSCKGLIREANFLAIFAGALLCEANFLAIFAGALLCMTHLLACLLAACYISQPDDIGKACLHRQRARNALLGAWIAFVTAILALVAALPPHSPFTCCGDGRMVFAGLYSIMHGIFLVQYYVSSITADEEMVEWMV